jgi:hypothetical protein
MFPDVPEEQRPLLEPHLKQVQGHVTQLEQQLAPFKPALDQGVDPQELPVLLNFNRQFNSDPTGTWLAMARNMLQEGALPEHLDLEALEEAVRGEAPMQEEGEYEGEGEYEEGEEPGYVQDLRDELEELRGMSMQDRQERQQQVSDRLFNQALENMRSQLKEAGVDDESMPEEPLLVASIITSQGDPQKALQSILGFREASLKGLTRKANGGKELEMPKGAPKSPEKRESGGDSMREASIAAEQALKQRNAAAAQ